MAGEVVAFVFLAYLGIPLFAYLIYWLWKKVRGKGADEGAETDA